jgi:hypothetical protein
MRRTVVDDPEHAACVVVRRPRHHLFDQAVKRAIPDALALPVPGDDPAPAMTIVTVFNVKAYNTRLYL